MFTWPNDLLAWADAHPVGVLYIGVLSWLLLTCIALSGGDRRR